MESNDLLYHYTDIYAVVSILESGVLYFSHYSKMNDKKEFIHSDNLIWKLVEDGIKNISNDKIDLNKLKKNIKEQIGDEFYIFSATQHEDDYEKDHGSLVMWRGYGNKPGRSGCAIVFDKNKLEEILCMYFFTGYYVIYNRIDYTFGFQLPKSYVKECNEITEWAKFMGKVFLLKDEEKKLFFKENYFLKKIKFQNLLIFILP